MTFYLVHLQVQFSTNVVCYFRFRDEVIKIKIHIPVKKAKNETHRHALCVTKQQKEFLSSFSKLYIALQPAEVGQNIF